MDDSGARVRRVEMDRLGVDLRLLPSKLSEMI